MQIYCQKKRWFDELAIASCEETLLEKQCNMDHNMDNMDHF